jgi:hypothetical protein
MFNYMENIVGFSREAFEEAYNQGLKSDDRSVEMNLTNRTYERIVELESENNSIEMIMIGFEKSIILCGGGMYEIIWMEKS